MMFRVHFTFSFGVVVFFFFGIVGRFTFFMFMCLGFGGAFRFFHENVILTLTAHKG